LNKSLHPEDTVEWRHIFEEDFTKKGLARRINLQKICKLID